MDNQVVTGSPAEATFFAPCHATGTRGDEAAVA